MHQISADVAVNDSLPNWHPLYQAALFETDPSKWLQRIRDAESAVVARLQQLFAAEGDHIEEDLVLDDALYVLQALRTRVLLSSELS